MDRRFSVALRAAVGASGLTLERIQQRLRQRGVALSVATLSYWQSGQRRPGRRASADAVRHLEHVLRVQPGFLVGQLAAPVAAQTGPPQRREVLRRYARPVTSLDRVPMDIEAYIRRSRTGGCFICALLAGSPDQPEEIVYDDGEHVAFLGRYPTMPGYTLVVPRVHREHVIRQLSRAEFLRLQDVVYRVARAVEAAVPSQRTYLLTLGSQQANSHVHFHIAPLPPGVPYEQQQFHALMAENGVIAWSAEQAAALALRVRAALAMQDDDLVTLRAWDLADSDWYAETAAHDELIQRFTAESPSVTADEVRVAIERLLAGADGAAGFLITDAQTGERLGNIALSHEDGVGDVSYWVAEAGRGRGVATRSLELFSRWAFATLALTELRLWAHVDNAASRRVAERAGYQRDPGRDARRQIKGQEWETAAYRLPA